MRVNLVGTREEVNRFLEVVEDKIDIKQLNIDFIEPPKTPANPVDKKDRFPTLEG